MCLCPIVFVMGVTRQAQVSIMVGVVVAKNQPVVGRQILVGVGLSIDAACHTHELADMQHRAIHQEEFTTHKTMRGIAFLVGDNRIDDRRAGLNLALDPAEVLLNGQRGSP
jgi:hypothetical protein